MRPSRVCWVWRQFSALTSQRVNESLTVLLCLAGSGSNPFQHLEKSAVLQEVKSAPGVSPGNTICTNESRCWIISIAALTLNHLTPCRSQARIFNETPINPRKCLHILTKIIYLLNQVKHLETVTHLLTDTWTPSHCVGFSLFSQGEHFGTTEATEAFFAMTRLFQSNDVRYKIWVNYPGILLT